MWRLKRIFAKQQIILEGYQGPIGFCLKVISEGLKDAQVAVYENSYFCQQSVGLHRSDKNHFLLQLGAVGRIKALCRLLKIPRCWYHSAKEC